MILTPCPYDPINGEQVVLQDIRPGVQLLENYSTFDDTNDDDVAPETLKSYKSWCP